MARRNTNQLPTPYQNFIHLNKYGKWLEDKGRRETWDETCDRYLKFFQARYPQIVTDKLYRELFSYINGLQVMPSMRAMMTAGKALELDNAAGYNCAFLPVNKPTAFDENMYLLMCGTGVGFSVERQYTNECPTIAANILQGSTVIHVDDSKIGWCIAFRELIAMLYSGMIPKWDLSELRPAGAKLKTFGGRASGPAPLDELFKFTVYQFKENKGNKLHSLACHDLVCKTGDAIVSGGVRRSALISLSNLSDDRMRGAKTGDWRSSTPWRQLANNSATYVDMPSMEIFFNEWQSLFNSKSGERGIYNVKAAQLQAERTGRRDSNYHFGTNPCSEIILRPEEFCNLSEVVIRAEDTINNLLDKVRIATILGTLQSTLTEFRYLNSNWKKNCEEERLLGVSLTGICDHEIFSGRLYGTGRTHLLEEFLTDMREQAIDTNKVYAELLEINQSASITAVKPSGTVSQLVDSANGIHPRYSKFYIRRIRLNKTDPIARLLVSQGAIYEDVTGKEQIEWVFSFPIKTPDCAIVRNDMSAIDQLELWLTYQTYWCEHKPSQTVYVRNHEWLEVGAWVYKHFNEMSGVSFLPFDESDTIYTQMPYEEMTEGQYYEMLKKVPVIDWSYMKQFETEDNTTVKTELACTADSCEL